MAARKETSPGSLMPLERITQSILLIRGHKVMLDADLAALYGVETGALTRAVRRNPDRFPQDFMFQLTEQEFNDLRCQFGTSSDWGGRRYPPYAFTEQGVAMLSSVLRSTRAVQVNIEIMRAFVRLRRMLAGHADLARKLDRMEDRTHHELTDNDIQHIANTHHAWRAPVGAGLVPARNVGATANGATTRVAPTYSDIPGLCKSAPLNEVRKHGHVLTPGRYVGAEAVENDGEPFEQKMQRPGKQLRKRQAGALRLDTSIAANLKELGYGG